MTDMGTFAKRMMRINQRGTVQRVPTAIFGKMASLSENLVGRPPYRIGMWPCKSEEAPLHAMGVWASLAYLLERWRDIEVYRLFVSFTEEQEALPTWDIQQMQFEVEDWEVEALDENIGIWGEYARVEAGWELRVFIENDLLTGQDNDTQSITEQASSLSEMLSRLPGVAQRIAEIIGAALLDETLPVYDQPTLVGEGEAEDLFRVVLQWESHLLAHLWDIEWDDEEIEEAYDDLLRTGRRGQGDFGAWLAAQAVGQTMRPGYSVIGDLLISLLGRFEAAFDSVPNAIPLVANSVFQMGEAQQAYSLLEAHTASFPQNALSWLKLGDLYARGGRTEDALDRFQTAIENEAVNQYLYTSYGNLLVLVAQYQDVFVDEFVLIDPDDFEPDDLVLREAVAAYTEALRIDSTVARVWYAKLEQLAALQEESAFWADFERLLPLDTRGEYVRELAEVLYEFEDVQPGVEALEALRYQYPERVDVLTNLALLHLIAEDGAAAKSVLEAARAKATDVAQLADIESLLLRAEDPEFEYRFGELATIVAAGNSLNADDVEFLEAASENAPNFVDVHLTLAQAYAAWDDQDAALEVLLDTQQKLPDHPEVLLMLSRILWDSGEQDLSFQYLNRGLQSFPFDVPLLVQAGRLLFMNQQYSESRQYLALAEEIQPRNPRLREVQMYIARELAENPDLARKATDQGE